MALAFTLTGIAVAPSPAAPATPAAPVLSASALPSEIAYGAELTVSGRLEEAAGGAGATPLELQAEPYPFRGFSTVARVTSGPEGGFAFAGVRPDRNTRLRVVLTGGSAPTDPVLTVIVDPLVAIDARSLGRGRTRLSLRIRHAAVGGAGSDSAWWYLAARGQRIFRLAAVTQTRELARGETYASVIVDPPARRFLYRVCLNPGWEHAMGAPTTHGPCPDHDFSVSHGVD